MEEQYQEELSFKLCKTQAEYIFKTITDDNASDKSLDKLFSNHKEFIWIIETYIRDEIEDDTPYYIHRYENGKKNSYPCTWDTKPTGHSKKVMRKYNIRQFKKGKEDFINGIASQIHNFLNGWLG